MAYDFELPAEIDPRADYPIGRNGPDVPFRTETFNLWGYDPTERLGLNVHYTSMAGDLSRFNAMILLFDGEDIYAGYFNGESREDGPGANNAFAINLSPFRLWRHVFAGVLHKTTSATSRETPFEAMPKLVAAFDLEAEMRSPPVEQGSQGDDGVHASSGTQARTAIRYEQLCSVRGTVRIGARSRTINALSTRARRRNSASIYASGAVGHTWATGLFPSGRGFHLCAYQHQPDGRVGFLHGFYFDGERHHPAEVLRFPFYSGRVDAEPYEIVMRAVGRTLTIRGLPRPAYMKATSPAFAPFVVSRAPGQFLLDDEVGGGVFERSLHPDYEFGGYFSA